MEAAGDHEEGRATTAFFGPAALVVHLAQAYVAVRLLEAVNYFEHYGLRRQGRKVRPVDSWDSDSWFTLFALVGLSRHADHHAYASRPFQALRTWEDSPKLPYGYIITTLMVIFANQRLRSRLGEELARRRLGPFAEPA
jgi:alkane 1-monooxygenase